MKEKMYKEELAKKVYNVSRITGEFTLRSGQISNEYFDKYLFESDPEILVDTVLCVILRSEAALEAFRKENINLVPLFTMEYLKKINS